MPDSGTRVKYGEQFSDGSRPDYTKWGAEMHHLLKVACDNIHGLFGPYISLRMQQIHTLFCSGFEAGFLTPYEPDYHR